MAIKEDIQKTMDALIAHEKVQAAFTFIDKDHANKVEELKEIVVVHGAPFLEHEVRSPLYKKKLAEYGATETAIDKAGNAFGWIRGTTEKVVLLEAHLDTVFDKDTELKITEKDGKIYCPGISDDTAGLATVLAVLRALRHAGIKLKGSLVAAGTTGEEGVGDLRGIKELLKNQKFDAVVGFEPGVVESITYQGTGSRRFEFVFKGPGGHSWQAFGNPSPIHAMGAAIGKISRIRVPKDPRTSYTVGTVSGGTSVNSIALECKCRVDIRSVSMEELAKTEKTIRGFIDEAVAEENAFWAESGKTISVEHIVIGDRPAGAPPADSDIVQTACAAISALGGVPKLNAPASTNANVPISQNIPAVVLRTGGTREGNHTLDEWYNPDGSQRGVKLALLMVLALCGIE